MTKTVSASCSPCSHRNQSSSIWTLTDLWRRPIPLKARLRRHGTSVRVSVWVSICPHHISLDCLREWIPSGWSPLKAVASPSACKPSISSHIIHTRTRVCTLVFHIYRGTLLTLIRILYGWLLLRHSLTSTQYKILRPFKKGDLWTSPLKQAEWSFSCLAVPPKTPQKECRSYTQT